MCMGSSKPPIIEGTKENHPFWENGYWKTHENPAKPPRVANQLPLLAPPPPSRSASSVAPADTDMVYGRGQLRIPLIKL